MVRHPFVAAAVGLVLALSATAAFAGPRHGVQVVSVGSAGDIELHNASHVPQRVALDGQRIATVAAGETLRIRDARAGRHTLTASPNRAKGLRAQSFHVDVRPSQTVRLAVAPYTGTVTVRNANDTALTVRVDGRDVGVVRAGGTLTVPELLAGSHSVALLSPYGAAAAARIRVNPGATTRWSPAAGVGTVRVRNGAERPMRVEIAGRAAGTLRPGEVLVADGVPEGRQVVTFTGPRGRTVAQTLKVRANRMAAWAFDPGPSIAVEVPRPPHPPRPAHRPSLPDHRDRDVAIIYSH